MRKVIFLLCLLAAGCIREGDGGTLKLTLRVSGNDPGTKAHVAAERTINNATIFIFDRPGGKLERVIRSDASGETSLSLSENVKSGLKTIWAYANSEVDVAGGYSIDSHPLGGGGLGENDFGGRSFAMCAVTNVVVSEGATASASVILSRKVSRTVLKSVRNMLPGSMPLEITGAYLADVYTADTPDRILPSESLWANKWGRGKDYSLSGTLECEDLTCWFPQTSVTIANGALAEFSLPPSDKGPRLYSMPNTLSSESVSGPYKTGDEWTPRLTKLVIAASILGHPCYYSIPLENPAANESAEYSITVYGVGTDDPEKTVTTGTVAVNRCVKAWESGSSYTDNSTPLYKMGVISSSPGHTSLSHIAQRMYLQMPVSDMDAAVRSGISFSASLKAPDGTVSDASGWITPVYSSGNLLWELNIACRAEGLLEVRAHYGGELLAKTTRSIYAPLLEAALEPLPITGEAYPVTLSWKSADGAYPISNSGAATDGEFFDSGLYSALLSGGTLEFDSATGGMLGTYVSGGNRYLRVSGLGSMANLIHSANANDSFSARSLPLLSRFRISTPCGVKSNWADARIRNWWANFYEGGKTGEFIYRDNDCYNADVQIAGLSDNMGYPSPVWSWEWTERWDYSFGCGNGTPLSGAGSRVGISAGKVKINNASSPGKANAAGLSQISASFTNSVSGETLTLPCLDVYIYKTFYFRSTVNSDWDIVYSAPDVSAFAADIPVSPVEKPLWSAEALERGAGYGGANVKPQYRTSIAEASQWFSSAAAFTRSSYGAGPEDKKHFVHFYSFEPAYADGVYHSF